MTAMLCLGLSMAGSVHAASGELLFQGLVNRRTAESRPGSAWLFQRPVRGGHAPPYVVYEADKILKLIPGDSFLARLDLDEPDSPHDVFRFIVLWEETTQQSFRSLHGEIRTHAPGGGKLGSFRFTSKLGGTEMTGCIQLADRDYCFAGKHGVGFL